MKKENFRKIAIEAAFVAGSHIRKSIGKKWKAGYKGEVNLVTEVDRKSERIIINVIKKAFPKHGFIAEESANLKEKVNNSGYRWVIDPLDGTTNFFHAFPVFCVSIALQKHEKTILGVVYDPTRDELFTAERTKGAFLNKKRIHVSNVKKLGKALLSTGFAYDRNRARDNNIDNFARLLKASQAVRRTGSAAIDLCYVACGRFDAFWELNLSPWDTAAGVLIVEEAGGKVTQFKGSKFTIFDKQVLASNSKIHSQMSSILS